MDKKKVTRIPSIFDSDDDDDDSSQTGSVAREEKIKEVDEASGNSTKNDATLQSEDTAFDGEAKSTDAPSDNDEQLKSEDTAIDDEVKSTGDIVDDVISTGDVEDDDGISTGDVEDDDDAISTGDVADDDDAMSTGHVDEDAMSCDEDSAAIAKEEKSINISNTTDNVTEGTDNETEGEEEAVNDENVSESENESLNVSKKTDVSSLKDDDDSDGKEDTDINESVDSNKIELETSYVTEKDSSMGKTKSDSSDSEYEGEELADKSSEVEMDNQSNSDVSDTAEKSDEEAANVSDVEKDDSDADVGRDDVDVDISRDDVDADVSGDDDDADLSKNSPEVDDRELLNREERNKEDEEAVDSFVEDAVSEDANTTGPVEEMEATSDGANTTGPVDEMEDMEDEADEEMGSEKDSAGDVEDNEKLALDLDDDVEEELDIEEEEDANDDVEYHQDVADIGEEVEDDINNIKEKNSDDDENNKEENRASVVNVSVRSDEEKQKENVEDIEEGKDRNNVRDSSYDIDMNEGDREDDGKSIDEGVEDDRKSIDEESGNKKDILVDGSIAGDEGKNASSKMDVTETDSESNDDDSVEEGDDSNVGEASKDFQDDKDERDDQSMHEEEKEDRDRSVLEADEKHDQSIEGGRKEDQSIDEGDEASDGYVIDLGESDDENDRNSQSKKVKRSSGNNSTGDEFSPQKRIDDANKSVFRPLSAVEKKTREINLEAPEENILPSTRDQSSSKKSIPLVRVPVRVEDIYTDSEEEEVKKDVEEDDATDSADEGDQKESVSVRSRQGSAERESSPSIVTSQDTPSNKPRIWVSSSIFNKPAEQPTTPSLPKTPASTRKRRGGHTTNFDREKCLYALSQGWRRELVHRATVNDSGSVRADVYYYTPEAKKLRSKVEIEDYLLRKQIADMTIENFSFIKVPIGGSEEQEIIRSATKVSNTPESSHKRKLEGTDTASSTPKSMKTQGSYIAKRGRPVAKKVIPPAKKIKLVVINNEQSKGKAPNGENSTHTFRSNLSQQKTYERQKPGSVKVSAGQTRPLNVVTGVDPKSWSSPPTTPPISKSLKEQMEYKATPGRKSRVNKTHVVFTTRLCEPLGLPVRVLSPMMSENARQQSFHCTGLCTLGAGTVPSLQCIKCLCLFHGKCTKMPTQTVELIQNGGAKFLCPNCYKENKMDPSTMKFTPPIPYEPLAYDLTSSGSEESESEPVDPEKLYPESYMRVNVSRPLAIPTPPTSPLSQDVVEIDTPASKTNTVLNGSGVSQSRFSNGKKSVPPPSQSQIGPYMTSGRNYQNTQGGSLYQIQAPGTSAVNPRYILVRHQQPNKNVSQMRGPRAVYLASNQLPVMISGATASYCMTAPQLVSAGNAVPLGTQFTQPLSSTVFQPVAEYEKQAEPPKVVTPIRKDLLQELSMSYRLLLRVFKYLNAKDLLVTSRVCLMWRDLSYSSTLWNNLRLRNICVRDWKLLALFLERRNTKSIDLRKMIFRTRKHPTPPQEKPTRKEEPSMCESGNTGPERISQTQRKSLEDIDKNQSRKDVHETSGDKESKTNNEQTLTNVKSIEDSPMSPVEVTPRSPTPQMDKSPSEVASRSPSKERSEDIVNEKPSSSIREISENWDEEGSKSPIIGVTKTPLKEGATNDKERSKSPIIGVAKTPLKEGSSSPLNEGKNSQVKDGSSSPVKEGSSSPVKEGSSSPVKEGSSSPVKEGSSSPVKEGSSSPVKEGSSSPVKVGSSSPVKDSSNSPQNENSMSPYKEGSSSPIKESSSSPMKEGLSRSTKECPSSPTKDSPSSPTKEGSSSPTKENSDRLPKESTSPEKESFKSPLRESPSKEISEVPVEKEYSKMDDCEISIDRDNESHLGKEDLGKNQTSKDSHKSSDDQKMDIDSTENKSLEEPMEIDDETQMNVEKGDMKRCEEKENTIEVKGEKTKQTVEEVSKSIGSSDAVEKLSVRRQSRALSSSSSKDDSIDSKPNTWRDICEALGTVRCLESVVLPPCSPEVLQLLLSNCKRILSVTAAELLSTPSSEFDPAYLMEASNLQELRIGSTLGFSFTTNFNFIKLQSLNVLVMKGFRGTWPYLGTNLTSLHLGPCHSFTPQTWNNISSMTNLKALWLEDGGSVGDSHITDTLNRLQQLRRLCLFRFTVGPKLGLALKKMTKLERIFVLQASSDEEAMGMKNHNMLAVTEHLKYVDELVWAISTQDIKVLSGVDHMHITSPKVKCYPSLSNESNGSDDWPLKLVQAVISRHLQSTKVRIMKLDPASAARMALSTL